MQSTACCTTLRPGGTAPDRDRPGGQGEDAGGGSRFFFGGKTPTAGLLGLAAPRRAPRGSRGPKGGLKGGSRGPHPGLTSGSQEDQPWRRAKTDDDPVNPRPGMKQVAAMTVGACRGGLLHCQVEYVEVAKLTPAKASAVKVAIPGDRTPRIVEQHILRNWGAGRIRDLADLPLAMIPTTSALSVVAGARNHRYQRCSSSPSI